MYTAQYKLQGGGCYCTLRSVQLDYSFHSAKRTEVHMARGTFCDTAG
jgi:hypothetical protein